jgi:hypothetical protein
MKPFLIATLLTLSLGFGSASNAQAQIVYGYSVPLEDDVVNSSGMMSSPSGYSPGSTGSTRGSTAGYSPFSTGNVNRMSSTRTLSSNLENGFGRGGGFSHTNIFMTPTGMNSGFGGMNTGFGSMNIMGMRRR